MEATASTEKKSDIPTVNYSVKAKTYRYIGVDDQAGDAVNPEAPGAVTPPTTPTVQGGK